MKGKVYPAGAGEAVQEAARMIGKGWAIIYPTETSYAVGCDATNPDAIERVRELKKRPRDKPVSVIVDSLETMKEYAELDEETVRLADTFMPGPLTLVVLKKTALPPVLSGESVAFRVSGHPFARELCREVKCPVTATSANISGEAPIFEVETDSEIVKGADAVFNAGTLPANRPSTVYDVAQRKILREGSITEEQIRKALEEGK